jgi:ferric-dicitrate binding protein FerR (iron transport regulator)
VSNQPPRDRDDAINYPLLDRYRTDECTREEREEVIRWMATDPAASSVLVWLRGIDAAAQHIDAAVDGDALWRDMQARLAASHAGNGKEIGAGLARPEPAAVRRAWAPRLGAGQRYPRWAAHAFRGIAAGAVVAGGIVTWMGRHGAAPPPVRVAPVTTRTYQTHAGQRALVQLSDGTRATLAPRSTLSVETSYDDVSRDVVLEGRAYFEVAHDSTKPFRVRSQSAVTQDLGTKFDLSAYPGDPAVSVVVADGRVAFDVADSAQGRPAATARAIARAAASGVVLGYGDLGRLMPHGRIVVDHGVDVDKYIGWTQGTLAFVNAPLRIVVPQLSRWYDIDIQLRDDALLSRPLTVTLTTESTAEMLQILAASLDAHVERAGRVVTLTARTPAR